MNASFGRFGLKASSAFNAEEANFDSSFYRMNQRNVDNLWGYLYSHLRDMRHFYVSWFGECLSHTLIGRAFSRNYFHRDFYSRLTYDKAFPYNFRIRRLDKDKQHAQSAREATSQHRDFRMLLLDYYKTTRYVYVRSSCQI